MMWKSRTIKLLRSQSVITGNVENLWGVLAIRHRCLIHSIPSAFFPVGNAQNAQSDDRLTTSENGNDTINENLYSNHTTTNHPLQSRLQPTKLSRADASKKHSNVLSIPPPIENFVDSPFVQLGLSPVFAQSLQHTFRIEAPSSVQRAAIPAILSGKDTVVGAETGTGKTLAALLPILQLLKNDEDERRKLNQSRRSLRPLVLILVPTRELLLQQLAVCKKLSHLVRFRAEALNTELATEKIRRNLDMSPLDILISTPHTLLKYLRHERIYLSEVKYVLMDEADAMLDDRNGFMDDVYQIVGAIKERIRYNDQYRHLVEKTKKAKIDPIRGRELPITRQTCQFVLLSASVLEYIQSAFLHLLPSLSSVHAKTMHTLPLGLSIHWMHVGTKDRLDMLVELLKNESKSRTSNKKAITPPPEVLAQYPSLAKLTAEEADKPTFSFGPTIIFCNSIPSCHAVEHRLRNEGLGDYITSLHGDIPPHLRVSMFRAFEAQAKPILLCTDIAARGIDFQFNRSPHIIQFDMALSPVVFLHRVGRTARMGKSGRATVLVTKADRVLAEAIEKAMKLQQPVHSLSADKADYHPGHGTVKKDRTSSVLPSIRFASNSESTQSIPDNHIPSIYSTAVPKASINQFTEVPFLADPDIHKSGQLSPVDSAPQLRSYANQTIAAIMASRGARRWDHYKSKGQKLKEIIEDSKEATFRRKIRQVKELMKDPQKLKDHLRNRKRSARQGALQASRIRKSVSEPGGGFRDVQPSHTKSSVRKNEHSAPSAPSSPPNRRSLVGRKIRV